MGVPIVKEHTVPVLITAALPADQGVCLFPLCRCHAVKGTVLPALYGRQSFIWVLSHAFPPFCFSVPFSPKRLPASSSQAAYRSFHRKRQNSLAPLLLLSPQSHAALRGPRQWRLVSALARSPQLRDILSRSGSLRCFPYRGIPFRTVIHFSRCSSSMNYPKSTPKRPPAPYIHKVGNQPEKLSISTLLELW